MPPSPGRHSRLCRRRIPRRVRRCRVCGAWNLKAVDYVLIVAGMVGAGWLLLMWL